MKLSDLKIIVTGAAQGMGAVFAQKLAQAGAQVAAGDINEAGLETLANQATEAGKASVGTLHIRKVDVASATEVTAFVRWAEEAMGGLNGLVNNAAMLRDRLLVRKDRKTGEITVLSREDWQAVIDVNLTGATLMAREVAARMVEAEARGVIINMSSVARHGNRGQSSYVAAKASLAANTVTWARELAPFGIRVGAIAPGMIETPMTRGMRQTARDALVANVPAGRIGEPEDIWLGVKFIVECDYFNGRTVAIDGGLTM